MKLPAIFCFLAMFVLFQACNQDDTVEPADDNEEEESLETGIRVDVKPADTDNPLNGVDVNRYESRDAHDRGDDPVEILTTEEKAEFVNPYAYFEGLDEGFHFFTARHDDYGDGAREVFVDEDDNYKDNKVTIFLRE